MYLSLSVPERSEGTEVSKMAVRRRKDFGGGGAARKVSWRGGDDMTGRAGGSETVTRDGQGAQSRRSSL